VLGFKEKPVKTVTLVPVPVAEAEKRFLAGFYKLEQAMALQAR
jgi:hypothetical protein